MIQRIVKRLRADTRGAAVIELALVAPMFALVVIGLVDLSNAFSRKLALEQAAQRAVEKIMQTTGDDTVETTLTREAVCQVNGTDNSGNCKTSPISASDVTVTWRLECVVPATGTMTIQSNNDSVAFDALTCPALTREQRYVQVSIQDKYAPLFPVHFASFNTSDNTYHISAVAGTRTQ